MKKEYLFDTGFLTLAIMSKLPEKWVRAWNEIINQAKVGCVIEPVIAEAYHQLMRKGINKERAKEEIMRIKSAESLNILDLDDNDALKAGFYYTQFKGIKLSYTDCFILAIAEKLNLRIYTTDHNIKRVAREKNIQCDHVPID